MRRHSARIARSLVTVIALTFIQVIAGPILTPQLSTASAEASTFNSTDMIVQMDVNLPNTFEFSSTRIWDQLRSSDAIQSVQLPFTSSGGGYVTFANGTGGTQFANFSSPIDPYLDQTSSTLKKNLSVFTWIYPTGNGVIIDEVGGDGGTYGGWYASHIEMVSGTLRFRVWAMNPVVTSSIPTPLENWYYVGYTYNATTQVFNTYVNGQLAGTATGVNRAVPWENNANSYFSIGRADATNMGDGTGGDFRFGSLHIFRSPLTQATIQNNFQAGAARFGPTIATPSNQSVVSGRTATFTASACSAATSGSSTCTYQWQQSTDGGTTFTDIAGATSLSYTTPSISMAANGYRYRIKATDPGTGTSAATDVFSFSGAATLTVTDPPGSDTDTALAFAANRYAWAPDSNEFDIANAITMQAWVYQTDSIAGNWNMVLNKESSYQLGTIDGTWSFALRSTGWSGVNTLVPSRLNTWQHVALTRAANSSTANLYIDGQLRWSGNADGAGTSALANTTFPFTIGGRSTDGQTFGAPFVGQIDEVRVFNSARTASQIQSDMNTYGPINTASLALYYDFNEGTGTSLFNRVNGVTSGSDLTVVNSPSWDGSMIESTTVSAAYTVKTFLRSYITSTGGWRVPNGVTRVRALVIGGGGGGGNDEGGGGGGGGFIDTTTLIFSPNAIARVTVGSGGVGADGNDVFYASNGQNSLLDTLIAVGGGAGGSSVNTNIGVRNGSAGGSGGGGAGESLSNRAGGAGTATQGFAGGIGITGGSGGGGGGAIEGGNTDGNGLGGDGRTSDISGSNVIYAGGGGGGNGNTGSTSYAGGDGGGGRGGSSNVTALGGTAGRGGGGGGGGSLASASSSVAFSGADGGSGVIIIRWITAQRPIFTQPLIDTTTAGLTDTITVSANPISPLIRNYQWQSSTDTGTTWSNIASGSGALTNTYTTPILETTTSGPRFQYRVIVTDSDTAGLSIVDTSVAVFIVVNPRITFSGTFTPQKYGEGDSDTFTVLNGTGNKTVVRTSSNRAGVSWDFVTLNTAVVNVAPTVSVGTYLETITATDTRGAQTQLVISVVVTKADTITVTALARSDTYTGSALTFTPSFTVTGLKNSDTVTPVIYNFSGADNAGTNFASSTTRPINAGSYIITPSVPASLTDSYTAVTIVTGALTINRATRTLAVIAPASPLKYGETRTITSTLSAGAGDGALTYLTSTPDSCTVSSTTVQAVRASGSCSFTAQITRGNNFETATATAATTTLSRADTITVQLRNPVTLTFTGNPAASLPTQTIIGLVHTDAATTTRLYSHPASAVGAPESYAALTNSAIVPTDVESYTVSSSTLNFSSGLASNYVNIVYETSTLIINQANQQPLRIAMYGAYIGNSYSIITDGGSGSGVVVESTTAGSTASNCVINSRVLTTTSTVQSVCNILVTKGASRNFKLETTTAQITFYLFIPVVSAPVASGGPTIGITGENTVTIDAVGAPTISSLSLTTISVSAEGSFTIRGTGFGSSSLTVKFWRDKSVTVTPTNDTTIAVPFADIAASGAQSGRIMVITAGGIGVSVDRLTINP